MEPVKLTLFLLALLGWSISAPIAWAGVHPDSTSPPRIAVVAMTSNVDGVDPEILESAITEALVDGGRFDTVARTKIVAVLSE